MGLYALCYNCARTNLYETIMQHRTKQVTVIQRGQRRSESRSCYWPFSILQEWREEGMRQISPVSGADTGRVPQKLLPTAAVQSLPQTWEIGGAAPTGLRPCSTLGSASRQPRSRSHSGGGPLSLGLPSSRGAAAWIRFSIY